MKEQGIEGKYVFGTAVADLGSPTDDGSIGGRMKLQTMMIIASAVCAAFPLVQSSSAEEALPGSLLPSQTETVIQYQMPVPVDGCSQRNLAQMKDAFKVKDGKVREINLRLLRKAVAGGLSNYETFTGEMKTGQPVFTRHTANKCNAGIDVFRIHTPAGPATKWVLALAMPKGAYRHHTVLAMKGFVRDEMKNSGFLPIDDIPPGEYSRKEWPEDYEVWIFDPSRVKTVPMEENNDYLICLLWSNDAPIDVWSSVLFMDDFLPVNAAPSSQLRNALWATAFGLSKEASQEDLLLHGFFLKDLEKVKQGVAKGQNLRDFWTKYESGLPFAVIEAASPTLLKYLLDQGLNFDVGFVPDYEKRRWNPAAVGKKPIDFALEKGLSAEVELLLANGLPLSGDALVTAVFSQKRQLVAMLLERGADINRVNDRGLTPLVAAVQTDDTDMVKYLLDKGASATAVDDILLWAIVHHNMEVIKILVANGANVNGRQATRKGNTGRAMIFTAGIDARRSGERSKNLEMVKYLVEHGADPHVKDKDYGDKTLYEVVITDRGKGAKAIAEYLQTVP